MDILRLVNAIKRKMWIIFLFSFAGGGLAGFVAFFLTTPTYQAETTLYIMNRNRTSIIGESPNMEDIMTSRQMIKDYGEIIRSRKVMSAVLRDVKGTELTEEILQRMVSVDLKKDSNVMAIRVVWYDPETAANLANSISKAFTAKIRELTNSNNVGVLDEALVPDQNMPMGRTKKAMMGFLAGMAMGFGLIYILEVFDTTIRDTRDVEQGLKQRVVGIIPVHDIH